MQANCTYSDTSNMAFHKRPVPAIVLFEFIAWSLFFFRGCESATCPLISPPSAFAPAIPYKSSPVLTDNVSAALENVIATFISEDSIPHYAVAVVHQDQTVFTSGLATTPFMVGSITKTFTALGALILREKGLLSLDDPVKKFLPNFSIINPYAPHDTTLRELMGHVSGMPRELCRGLRISDRSEEQCPVVESDVLNSVAKMELVRPPWSAEPAYSNLGFALLGHSWEKAMSPPKSWQDFVMEEIVKPLGLNGTGIDLTNVTLAGNVTDGAKKYDIGWQGPAAGMYSTATDLAKYLRFLLNASPPLISDAVIREWTRPSTIFPDSQGGYALPWELIHINSTRDFVITKDGAIATYKAFIAIHPPTQIGVSVLFVITNSTTPAPSGLGRQLLNVLIPAVETANIAILDPFYTGHYVCKATPVIFSQSLNTTVEVLEGYIDVTGSPSLGLSTFVNISLIRSEQNGHLRASQALLLKNSTENSFWILAEGSNVNCATIFGTISNSPSIKSPNYPGSVYVDEYVFDLGNRTLKWPAYGAVCVKQQKAQY